MLSIWVFYLKKLVELRRNDTKLATFFVIGYGYGSAVVDDIRKREGKAKCTAFVARKRNKEDVYSSSHQKL
jgi:hypothetical protein